MSDTSTSDTVNKVTFELASPEALLVSTTADMVVVPGAEGDFGVLPGHAPFISEVRPGVIDVYQADRIEERVFDLMERTNSVLTEQHAELENISRELARLRG